MLKKFVTLFRIARALSLSGALDIIYKFHKPPRSIRLFFKIFSISFDNKKTTDNSLDDAEKLCKSIQNMGTSFIKLGQFLSTRPDIIGDELTEKLEKLQDRVPPFPEEKAKEILLNNIGKDNYNSILNISQPIAAASIAQVHKAQINDGGIIKDVAIKILRPDIKKIFN